MKKLLPVVFSILFLLSILSSCTNAPTQLTNEIDASKPLTGAEIYATISPSTVEVYAENDYSSAIGTGFYLDESGTVVTNYHVIKDCSRAYVTASDGGTYEVKSILGHSEELDIAILSTTKTNSIPVETCTSVTTGETVYVLGSSKGLTGTFSEGLVSTAERNFNNSTYIQISAPISNGNSGGPVVNDMGKVVGIACALLEDGQNLNFAIPISALEQISKDQSITMEEFYESTSEYAHLYDRVVEHGSSLAVRTITLGDSITAKYVLAKWENGETTEARLIEIMDQYGPNQGGGQLYIIDPGTFVEEIDEWCFDSCRRPGDYAIIENDYGCSICYISILNEILE